MKPEQNNQQSNWLAETEEVVNAEAAQINGGAMGATTSSSLQNAIQNTQQTYQLQNANQNTQQTYQLQNATQETHISSFIDDLSSHYSKSS